MKIAVCIKQVPAVSEGDMDPETGVLKRSSLDTVVNVYDLAALEAALQIKANVPSEIHVFTMGPEKAENVLREAFAMGADEGYLVCSRAFAGADVLATSYTLMQALTSAGHYDLILCGKQTTDGDTAQVSGALARWLEIPHINWVTEVSEVDGQKVNLKYNMENRSVSAEVKIPCLLSVEKDSFTPRMPSLKLKIAGKKKEIHRLSLADFSDQQEEHYGLQGSATRVKKIFPPQMTQRHEVIWMDGKEAARYIAEIMVGQRERSGYGSDR